MKERKEGTTGKEKECKNEGGKEGGMVCKKNGRKEGKKGSTVVSSV